MERGQGQRIDGHAAEDVVHGRVAGDDRVVDAVARHAAPPGHRPDHVVDLLDGGRLQAPQIVGVLEGECDPRDDVGAVGALGVHRRGPVDDLSGPEIDELRRDRARPQVDGQPEDVLRGVLGLDVEDLAVFVQDRRDPAGRAERLAAELGRASPAAGAAPGDFERRPERIGHGDGRVERRLLQDERQLLDGRIDEGGRGNARIEDGDLFQPRPGQGLDDEIAA